MQKGIRVITFILLAFSQISTVRANETSELRELIQNQTEQLKQLQQRLDELETKQKQQNLKTEEKISEAMKNENVAASFRFNPLSIPPAIVLPARDIPGTRATA